MRPMLRPGAHVLERRDRRLQVGLDPRQAVLLRDEDPVRRTLRLLTTPGGATARPDPATLAALAEAGLLVDEEVLRPLVAVAAPGAPSRHDRAALARSDGEDALGLVERRRRHRTTVIGFGGPPGPRLAETLAGLLGEAGLPARPGSGPRPGDRVAVLVGVGEPRRELVDEAVRADLPHLVVRMREGEAVLGPFVAPGRTACLRCVDAHLTDADPCWPLLVVQYAARAAGDRSDGVPEPVDGLLAAVAVAWAARDVASYAEDRRPTTWSTTLRLDGQLASIETQPWLRHPACGCSWGEPALDHHRSDTMGT
ncbi:MAG TPA: TOMM precursor leader peptide-binding protein [Nocardioidaceae bacterium]|nr:TOMM precursor leader peptide-binding protein [Nocardioidaceae bacterium]